MVKKMERITVLDGTGQTLFFWSVTGGTPTILDLLLLN